MTIGLGKWHLTPRDQRSPSGPFENWPLATMRLPHEWPGLWSPNSSASPLAGVGRPLPVCEGYDPLVAFSGQLELLVVEADGGAAFADLAHQVATGMRSR